MQRGIHVCGLHAKPENWVWLEVGRRPLAKCKRLQAVCWEELKSIASTSFFFPLNSLYGDGVWKLDIQPAGNLITDSWN